ncbi:hypothetical protein DE4576_03384 [Mycobacterium marinum]|uniref:hypothetical protein n=1 Tax=Mycobacterium marinum TaxID=1781 RepID=UPI000E3BC446|nr:hypothetical protein [Mycobacterium marinum]RFZ65615.1 hypothetical protein DE4576_03384 [Mycobacterium marinum]
MVAEKKRKQELKDLAHELRQLLGAYEIMRYIEDHDSRCQNDADKFGNIVNYFKDSVYLHSRNLLNALTNKIETEIGTVPADIKSETWAKIKRPAERFVFHSKEIRDQRGVSNIIDRRHLNTYAPELTEEAKRCWNDWKNHQTCSAADKEKLQQWFDTAVREAQDDCARLKQLLK